jgi:CRISPR-associated helicase Cas3
MVVIHAPVGAGKSYIVCELLRQKAMRPERSCVILTFPTLALMNAQVETLRKNTEWIRVIQPDVHTFNSDEWKGKAALFEYSSEVIFRLLAKHENPERLDKAEFISKSLDEMFFISRTGAVVTTPDVLYLMVKGVYDRKLKAHAKGAIIFFDEFHLYHNLGNFRVLLEKLIDFGARLVFMSATPYFSEEVQNFLNDYQHNIIEIPCKEETSEGVLPFNYELEVEILNLKYTNRNILIQALMEILPTCSKPAAVIFDSLFRLKQVTPDLEKQLRMRDSAFNFLHYHGMAKDRLNLTSETILWGTSSIEVGVDFKNLRTLITEASYWPNAIQRLGRVGRHGPGKAYLLTSRRFDPVSHELGSVCSRSDFEQKGMMRILREPKNELIHGNMFRGDSHSFVLLDIGADDEKRRIVFYDEGIFSMFSILDYCENWRRITGWEEKMDVLRKYKFPDNRMREILIKDLVFPYRGVLVGKLLGWYRNISVRNFGADGLVIAPDGDSSIRFD